MGIRETMNENRNLTIGVSIGIIVLAIVGIVMMLRGSTPAGPPPQASVTKAYATVDDGKNYFEVDDGKLPPFMHEGKEAVWAYVYSCDGGATKKVVFLQKFTPQAQQNLAGLVANQAGKTSLQMMLSPSHAMPGLLVKKPGVGQWYDAMNPQVRSVFAPPCPQGMLMLPK